MSVDPRQRLLPRLDLDVVEVQRGPEPGGLGGAYRAFGETLRGLKTTMARLVEGPMTIQYPEEKTPVYLRFRGRHKLHKFEDTGLEKCVGCSLGQLPPARPTASASSRPRTSPGNGSRPASATPPSTRSTSSRCIFCGYCEIACPFDAITMGHDYEMADYDRREPDLHQGDAAGRAGRADAAEKRGGIVDGGGRLLRLPRSARSAARSAWISMRNPFYSGVGAGSSTFSPWAALFLLLTLRLRSRRPSSRLRRRSDGPIRLRSCLRRRRRRVEGLFQR